MLSGVSHYFCSRKMKKRLTMNVIWKIMLTFAAKRLREQAAPQQFEPARLRSACTVLAASYGKSVTDIASEAFSLSIARTSTTLMNNWKSLDVLPLVLIVVAHAIYIIQGCEPFFYSIIRAVEGLSLRIVDRLTLLLYINERNDETFNEKWVLSSAAQGGNRNDRNNK